MASNRTFQGSAYIQSVACSDPTTPAKNDPVRLGNMTGVCLVTEDSAGNATIDFGPGEWSLATKGIDGNGNSAIAIGDALYYTDGDTPKINKKTTGTPFGIALGAVGSGNNGTINVLHLPQAG